MKTKKKSRFLTFVASWVPGAAEMYMGFMKMGLSMMALFMLIIIVTAWTNQAALAGFLVVEWFYCFFHANHLASLSDEDFAEVKDGYLFGLDELPSTKNFVEKYSKWIAYGLILIGISFLWSTVTSILYSILPESYHYICRMMWRIGDYVPSILIGCGIVFLGVKLLEGKKMEVAENKNATPEGNDGENRQ